MGVLRGTFFIVGTTIGAGFLTGAELVRFFRAENFLFPVFFSSAIFFGMCLLFLSEGRKHGGYRGALSALFGKREGIAETVAALFSFIPCAGMLAGLDAILPAFSPLLSLIGLAVGVTVLGKGTKGISLFNLILVPLLLLFIFVFGRGDKSFFYPSVGNSGFAGGAVYAGMNAFLAAPVLMDAGKDMKKILPPAILSALFVAVSALWILGGIYREGAGAINAEMPYLYVMRGKKIFFVAVACAILTSFVSALYPPYRLCDRAKGHKKTAAKGFVLLAAFSLSRFGLTGIVNYFYPALGVAGLCLSAFCIFHDYLFEKYHEKIHSRRQHAQDRRRAHDEIELEDLPAVHDKVAESRFGDDVLSHNGTDPRHSHVDFQHGNKGRKRRRNHELS